MTPYMKIVYPMERLTCIITTQDIVQFYKV